MTDRRANRGKSGHRNPNCTIGSETELGLALLDVLRLEGDGEEPVYTEGQLHDYYASLGVWRAVPNHELSCIVQSFDGHRIGAKKGGKKLKIGAGNVKGAIDLACAHVRNDAFFSDAEIVLVFKNGALRLVNGAVTLEELSPKHRARHSYNFDYDPNAKCDRFLQMLDEHFEGDEDAKEKIALLQEFFGACLFRLAVKYQKCLAMPSGGGSGRSTLLEIVEAGMPKDTVSHIEAKDLRSAERLSRMVGKLLNFSDEVPPDAFLESEAFKKVVTGNNVTAEVKYRPSYDFRPIAGHVFPIQVAPAAELTSAFFARFLIIRYNHDFRKKPSRVMDLAKSIIDAEIPGLIAWMVRGVLRLRAANSYTVPASHAIEEQKWQLSADTVRAFLEEQCTRAIFEEPRNRAWDRWGQPTGHPACPHDWTPASLLYENYDAWCRINGHRKPVAVPEFKRRIEDIGYKQAKTEDGRFYGVRSLALAQAAENASPNFPKTILKGAISSLQDHLRSRTN